MMQSDPGAGRPGIDKDLSMVATGIAVLRELASDPADSKDGARIYDFSIKWGVLMSGRLKRLEYYYRAGDLTEYQERRYRELRRELKEAASLTEWLGIGPPTVPLDG